ELGEEVVLHRPDRVESKAIGQLDLLERLLIATILAPLVVWLRDLQLVEEVEFHASSLLRCVRVLRLVQRRDGRGGRADVLTCGRSDVLKSAEEADLSSPYST